MTSAAHADFALMRHTLDALNAHFAWLIDHQDGKGVADLFTEEGVYDMSNGVYRGRREIAAFYEARKSRGRRTARHVFTNFTVAALGPRRAKGTLVLTLYAYDGEPPHPALPILIADYEDVYALGSDEAWRYESRTLKPVFGGVPRLAGKGAAGR